MKTVWVIAAIVAAAMLLGVLAGKLLLTKML